MKRYLWVLALTVGLGLIPAQPARAGIIMDKVVLEHEWEDDEYQGILCLNSFGEWAWLELNLDGKFYQPATGGSHLLALDFSFPEVSEELSFGADYQWDRSYRSLAGNMGFDWKPLKGFKVGLDVAAKSRDAFAAADSKYRYGSNEEKLALSYNINKWILKSKLTRLDRDYPETRYYSSLKYDLDDEISGDFTKKLRTGVIYRETTADYPYDTSLTRDYWKEEWSWYGKYRHSANRVWSWEYSRSEREKGFDRDLARRDFELEYNWWKKKTYNVKLGLTLAAIDYFTDSPVDYDDEDEAETNEATDTQSRLERKAFLEYKIFFNRFTWETEFFSFVKDYKAGGVSDWLNSGVKVTLLWEYEKYKISLELAPSGGSRSDTPFYQLKTTYYPKGEIE